MKKISYTNPNYGSNWLTTKLYNVPGILKYYKTKPAGILYEEPFIVDAYGYLIKTINIFQLSPSQINLIQLEINGQNFKYRIIYTLSNQPDIIEYQNEAGLERLRRYLRKLGWRGIESEYYDECDERSNVGGDLGSVPVMPEASVFQMPIHFDTRQSIRLDERSEAIPDPNPVESILEQSMYYTPPSDYNNSVFKLFQGNERKAFGQ